MKKIYDYEFVRIESGLLGLQKAEKNYQRIIHKYAEDGWRLVQIFAPSATGLSAGSKFYEMIFEREKIALDNNS